MQYDLVIKNGTVVDGTGLPKQQADVAIKDGLIQQVGRINAPANETIDAEGLIVSPGFIDPHTHYDGQLTWDPLALSSSWHGVTTVVMGNCGYTLAPCRPSDKEHEYMTKTFAKVEGMSLSALEAGVPWTWETYAEYLDTLDARLGVNAVPYIGHTAVRRYVMGEECFEREANDDEIQRMRMEVGKGMAAGACGFSTSQASSHVGYYEEPIPSRLATDREIEELCGAVGEANAGNLMVLCRSAIEGINADDRKLLIRLSADNGRPVIIQGRLIQEAIDAGAGVFGLLQARPFDRIFNLKHTTVLDGLLTWGGVLRKPMDERLRLLRDPEARAAMRHDVDHPNTDRSKGVVLPAPPWETIFVNTVKLDKNRGLEGKSVVEISKETGKHIADVIVDLALEEDLETFFRYFKGRTDAEEEKMLRDLRSPYAVLGISDAGAHLDRDDGAYYATHFLQEYVRDKGLFSLEEAVRMLTFVPAAVWNIYDRGILRPGYAADVAIFDAAKIRLVSKDMSNDLPGGDYRFSAVPDGVNYTIVNGQVLIKDREHQGAYPGKVIRSNKVSRPAIGVS